MTQHVRNKLYAIACAMTVLLYGNAISQVDSSSAILSGNARIFQRQMTQLEADVRANNPSLKSAAHGLKRLMQWYPHEPALIRHRLA